MAFICLSDAKENWGTLQFSLQDLIKSKNYGLQPQRIILERKYVQCLKNKTVSYQWPNLVSSKPILTIYTWLPYLVLFDACLKLI
jgi:hypothetical protein